MSEMNIKTEQQNAAQTAKALKKAQKKAPKGWVRWSGLGLFIAIIGGLVGLSYLGISYGLKKQIEHYASQAWGAEINIGSLNFSLLPVGVSVNNIALTNPELPAQNQVQIKQLKATVNVYHLVVGRTVIEDLVFSGFAMNQPRKKPGKVYPKVKKEVVKSGSGLMSSFNMPDMSLPDPKAILERETLETLTAAQAIQAELTKIEQAWSKMQKDIPNEQAIKDYQKRFEALTKGDFSNPRVLLQKQQEFESLKKEVESKQKLLKDGKQLLASVNTIKNDVQTLPSLPMKDYNRLMAKYNLSGQGVSNVTYLLFGPKIQTWMNMGQEWYVKLSPYIEQAQEWRAQQAAEAEVAEKLKIKRAIGTMVRFKEFDPQPDFMIKRIHGDGLIEWGALTLAAKNINFDQSNSKKPVTFVVKAQPVGQVSPLTIVGESNYVKPDAPVNKAKFDLADYRLSEAVLSGEKAMPVIMREGALNLTGDLALVGISQIKGQFDAGFKGVNLDASSSDSADVRRYIAPILADIKQFNVHSDISGEALFPKLEARSDLDKLLATAFNKALNRELDLLKVDVKKQLDALLAEQLGPINTQLAGLLGEQNALNSQGLDLEKLLSGKAPSFDQKALEKKAAEEAEKAIQKEAEKALGDKAKNLLKGFGF